MHIDLHAIVHLRLEGAESALRAAALWSVRVRNQCFVFLADVSSVDMTPDKQKRDGAEQRLASASAANIRRCDQHRTACGV